MSKAIETLNFTESGIGLTYAEIQERRDRLHEAREWEDRPEILAEYAIEERILRAVVAAILAEYEEEHLEQLAGWKESCQTQ